MQGKDGVIELVEKALAEDIEVGLILKEGLIRGMDEIGRKFSSGECFVPEMLVSAQAMKAGLKHLEPFLKGEEKRKMGTVILGTVKGDMHDIGKNLVGMILEGGGFEVIDLGINTPVDKFVSKAKENPNAVIGMSALLTTTIGNMKLVVEALRSEGLNNKVVIGGAAVSQKFMEEIKADAYSRDAAKAVAIVKELLGIKSV
ncbi:MAG: cobalamin-binding protein [Ignavibacteria bacterium]|nr:cobalamin-binding protein [Ignavibacteria bacterium]MCU7505012.1 cobalamin-binding protein [Ignavibacteria bacterium]MCU7514854.1 cobalamin-binding protein [Ignavibacteria bacterium]